MRHPLWPPSYLVQQSNITCSKLKKIKLQQRSISQILDNHLWQRHVCWQPYHWHWHSRGPSITQRKQTKLHENLNKSQRLKIELNRSKESNRRKRLNERNSHKDKSTISQKLVTMFSIKVNPLYLFYSMAWRSCLLHLKKQNFLLKTFLRTLKNLS